MASILKEWLIKSLLLEQRGGIWQVGAGGRRQERMGAADQERLPRGRCGFRRMNKSLKIGWWRGGHSGHRDWHLRMSFVIYPASSVPVTTAPCTAAHGPLGLLSLFTAAETWSVSSGQGHRGCFDGSAHQGRVQLSPLIFHKCRFWRPQGGWGVHEQREWREGTEYEYRHLCEKAQGDLLGWWICLLLWLVMVSWVYTYIGLSDRVPKQGQFIAYGSYFHKAIKKSIGTSKFLAAFKKCLFFSIKLT